MLIGVAITLCIRGYRFGESNHAVYLLDALRRLYPTILTHDWWTQSTLQYHYAFNLLSTTLMRLGVIEPAFLLGYSALALLLHLGWFRLTRLLGGDVRDYILSVVLFYLLAGGLALGSYHFLQDSSFLPSNISNVAMLWGVIFWTERRFPLAGLALGIAGLFHINHALMGIGLWGALTALDLVRRQRLSRSWAGGLALLILLCIPAIAPVVQTVLHRSGGIPRQEFIDLFVHLRHPHHFDPATWPVALWITFLAPFPLAALVARDQWNDPATARIVDIARVLIGVTVIALLSAGLWFVSETLVQLNLYRFAIYLKLITCILAARWLVTHGVTRPIVRLAVVLLLIMVMVTLVTVKVAVPNSPIGAFLQSNFVSVSATLALCALSMAVLQKSLHKGVAIGVSALALAPLLLWPHLGLKVGAVRADPPEYVKLAKWAASNTPVDAVFVVPPQEQSFRLHARRAIVVNFKNVPQLSAELPEWRDRLQRVLGMDDVMALPRGMGKTLSAIAQRYDALSPEHLSQIADRYGAAYVVTATNKQPPFESGFILLETAGPYRLYKVNPAGRAPLQEPDASGGQP